MPDTAAKARAAIPIAEGLGTNQNPVRYLGQDYEALKAQCLASNTLFEDEAFPASSSSIGVNELGPDATKTKGVVWMRPKDIKPNPQFIVDGATRVDVRQGSVGNCWFLASVASLTLNEDFLYQVVPMNQSFETDYAGIFHFKLWQYGEWVDVVVDDRLPVKKGKLVFVKSGTDNEFWTALLEKAYAKLNGSYEALIGGLPFEALQDFTGGISEIYYLNEAPNDLFQIIQKVLKANSIIACSTVADSKEREKCTSKNIIKGHAYSLVGAEEVSYGDGKEQLIRVRNPWGYTEWNGPWSDNSPEWDNVDPIVKADLNKTCDDGEAWMPFSNFVQEYYRVEICHVSLGSMCSDKHHMWCVTQFNGNWKNGITAGGRPKNKDTYWKNTQFRFKLEEPDDDHDGPGNESYCTVIIGLMQKDRRKVKSTGGELYDIGFYVYRLDNCAGVQMGKDFFTKNKEVAKTDVYKAHREVSRRFKLPVGEYLIVPHTYYPALEANFCLRVLTEKNI
ncbi:calpain-8-like [Discoglossus pictus]